MKHLQCNRDLASTRSHLLVLCLDSGIRYQVKQSIKETNTGMSPHVLG